VLKVVRGHLYPVVSKALFPGTSLVVLEPGRLDTSSTSGYRGVAYDCRSVEGIVTFRERIVQALHITHWGSASPEVFRLWLNMMEIKQLVRSEDSNFTGVYPTATPLRVLHFPRPDRRHGFVRLLGPSFLQVEELKCVA